MMAILGIVEWKDLAKVSRVDVESGRLDRRAVLATGRKNVLMAEDIDHGSERVGGKKIK